MMAIAAAELGYRCHVFCPELDSPAAQVSAAATIADYTDPAALQAFAAAVDVITLEFENIPVASAERLARLRPVRPGPGVLRITQDRLLEKDFVRRTGAGTAPYATISSQADIAKAAAAIGPRAVLKTRRMGYDGKGQRTIALPPGSDAASIERALHEAWTDLGGGDCLLEGFVDFSMEISVIVARGQDGATVSYVPVENRHSQHILHYSLAPAIIAPETAARAERMARDIAAGLDLVGLMAVEMFVVADGGLLVNELAPRTHNSGHWTIEACLVSQFQQQVRAVCGLPLGAPDRHSDAVMENLLGDAVLRWPELLADPGAKLHLYGKAKARPGRKMGHVTRLYPLGQRAKGGGNPPR
jgi:5-(carboxyamino)imidazole ribonucleotide synthase